MLSTIDTPTARKRLHDGTEFSYVPRTPGNVCKGLYNISRDARPRTTNERDYLSPLSQWVVNSTGSSLLPPVPVVGCVPPASHSSDSRYIPELDPGLVENAKIPRRGNEQGYRRGSYTSSSSEGFFHTPSSSLGTNDGTLHFGANDFASLPHQHERNSMSTTSSSFGRNGPSPTLQMVVVYTPQSSSTDSWHALPDQPLHSSNEKTQGDENGFDVPTHFDDPFLSGHSQEPRRQARILPAPPKNRDDEEVELLQVKEFGPLVLQSPRKTGDHRKLTTEGKEDAKACSSDPGRQCPVCEKLLPSCEYMLERKELGSGICFRVDLQQYRKGIPDLYDTAKRNYNVPIKLDDSKRTIVIGHFVRTEDHPCAYFPIDATLSVNVQDCEFTSHGLRRRARSEDDREIVPSYRIEDSTLPTADTLDTWGRNLMAEFSRELPDFEPPVRDKFLFEYCRTIPFLPQHNLVNLTIRMISLAFWLHGTHPAIYPADLELHGSPLFRKSDTSIQQMLSLTARGQLRSIAVNAMEATETELFKCFDDAIMKPPEDVIVIGLCLWRLALLYRKLMKHYEVILYDVGVDRRREKQKVMYEAMITGHRLVYRDSISPYSPGWRLEDHLGTFGNNKRLASTFSKLKAADEEFYKENKEDNDDAHARKLFWEPMTEKKRRRRASGKE
ncbi:hypothetical protein BDZ45DRAFT_675964 [Acephala macrosclerotiorum]|nr:hypothetical protein BDZ45DRAFT_675964 [Acephala macrosclerotiorum]